MKKVLAIIAFSLFAVLGASAQEAVDTVFKNTVVVVDSMMLNDDVSKLVPVVKKEAQKVKRDWSQWRPDIKKAMWMAIVIPGGGQIYNRKYWKLPIVYGGFVGCFYAMRWNGMMYDSYQQAYMDIMDDDPNTKSYENMMHLGNKIDESNMERYKKVFKNRKDRFRRWRDLSMFCMIGVYALSVIDAYVDASLSQFDISDDLSLKVAPAYIDGRGQQMTASSGASSLQTGGLGVRCKLNF